MTPLAIAVGDSANGKITGQRSPGRVATTYASIRATCPTSCELRTSGECYALSGYVGFTVRRLDAAGDGRSHLRAARDEARALDALFPRGVPQDGARGGRDLRLHTSGDARSVPAARILAAAVARWYYRGGGKAWTYTHAWRDVPRREWGAVSVLASVDNPADAPAAMGQGYAPARYATELPPKAVVEHGVRWIPCPAQLRDDIGCADCRLCLDADGLRRRQAGIMFAAHGIRGGKLKRRLALLEEG